MIQGHIESGAGGASAVSDEIQAERSEATGLPLERGTLNVRVKNLGAAIKELGCYTMETQKDARKGPLRWWPVRIIWSNQYFNAFVVRHRDTSTDYLELMSDTNFKAMGARKDDPIVIQERSDG